MSLTLEKLQDLKKNLKNSGDLAIIGLNDFQGVNVTTTFWKKGLLDYLKIALSDDEIKPLVINAFSLTMNKTEHIDAFLDANLTLEEIKWSQIYSAVSALEKVMEDVKLPKQIGKLGCLYKYIYKPMTEDKNIKITDTLVNSCQPIVIYSSGVNNLMREVGNNPFSIQKDYKKRFVSPKFFYTLKKVNDKQTLKDVMNGIEQNFVHILGLNNKADIYALSAYVPKSLKDGNMNIFRELILNYNEELRNLCNDFKIAFIDTQSASDKYNKSEGNFHVTSAGHNAVANSILNMMYDRRVLGEIKGSDTSEEESIFKSCYYNDGSLGVYCKMKEKIKENLDRIYSMHGYERKRELEIKDEHRRECKIFEKVYRKTLHE